MYFEGNAPAKTKSPPWNMAELMFIRTMMVSVTAKNSNCQESVLIFTRERVPQKKNMMKDKEISNLRLKNKFVELRMMK